MEKDCSSLPAAVPSAASTAAITPLDRRRTCSVAVLGLGYVGSVTAACLARRGLRVVGVDVNRDKTQMVNQGRSPIVEQRVGELIAETVARGNLRATTDVRRAVRETDASLVCVGTPSRDNGDLDLQHLERVCRQIGAALRETDSFHTVIVRSTVLPGTTEEVVLPLLEQHSGKQCDRDFGLCFNPEFLREGSSVQDFLAPPFTLVGTRDPRHSRVVHDLFGWLDTEFLVRDIRTAEMVKYINNSYHALKVAFANEVGRLCRSLGIDSHGVMEIFCKDTKQNLSAYYLKPGYAFGGSCLPKDLRAILYQAKAMDVPLQVFQSALDSNRTQLELGIRLVEQAGRKRVGLLGLSFKAGTDDLRESPLVTLVETLSGRGYELRIFDSHVLLSRLVGSNKAYIERELPHISQLICDSIEQVVEQSDTIVIGNPAPEFRRVVDTLPADKQLIDLVRIVPEVHDLGDNYHGIGW